MKEKNQKQHISRHHVYPTSRFILNKPVDKHNALHKLFRNKTPEEIIETIKKWTTKSGKLKKLDNYKLAAWEILFGHKVSPAEAIQIIEKEWTFPGVILIKREGGE